MASQQCVVFKNPLWIEDCQDGGSRSVCLRTKTTFVGGPETPLLLFCITFCGNFCKLWPCGKLLARGLVLDYRIFQDLQPHAAFKLRRLISLPTYFLAGRPGNFSFICRKQSAQIWTVLAARTIQATLQPTAVDVYSTGMVSLNLYRSKISVNIRQHVARC